MTILQLLSHARRYPLFTIEDCRKWFPTTTRGTLLFQLAAYRKRGHLRRVQRGLYLLNDAPYPDPRAIASRMDPEATISLETVLHEHGVIPEVPFATTAVTPRKTVRRSVPQHGQFIFRHVKPTLHFGWRLVRFPPYTVRIASPEKALLDLLWFHRFERHPRAYIHELRLTLPKQFSRARFLRMARLYSHPQLLTLAEEVARH